MPIYEYTCQKCHSVFEELVFGNESTVSCPQCGAEKTQKLMSCCKHKSRSGKTAPVGAAPSGGGCGGCAGGNCATCH